MILGLEPGATSFGLSMTGSFLRWFFGTARAQLYWGHDFGSAAVLSLHVDLVASRRLLASWSHCLTAVCIRGYWPDFPANTDLWFSGQFSVDGHVGDGVNWGPVGVNSVNLIAGSYIVVFVVVARLSINAQRGRFGVWYFDLKLKVLKRTSAK